MKRAFGVAVAAAVACCPVPPDPATAVNEPVMRAAGTEPDGPAWREARAQLASLRDEFAPKRARTQHVKLVMEHAASGRRLEARGAVAVGRDDGLRMILLGPGGTTALDLWVCGDDYRYQVPALDMERRGRVRDGGREEGLPVGFLRWWFLGRLEGRLLSFGDRDGSRRFVLRDHDQVLTVRADGGLTVERGDETLAAQGGDCGRARYHHAGLGLVIEVDCERVDQGAPPERAFADPDEPDRLCASVEEGA